MAILRFLLKIHSLSRLPPVREKNLSKILEFLTLRPFRAATFMRRFPIRNSDSTFKKYFQAKNTVNIKRSIFFVFDKESADVEHF